MNYGRFFRLNQYTSKIEVGVAIYDYIDLPAYFNSSVSNTMSPKYPINVTITKDSVQFRVHFNAFVCCPIDKKGGAYFYDINEANNYSKKEGDIELSHMEDIILELPYKDDSTDKLYNNIKEIYNARFPLLKSDDDIQWSYLKQFICARYDAGDDEMEETLYKTLYKRMHDHIDRERSYSTLWLMGLYKADQDGQDRRIDVYDDKSKDIVGFLRKLLLDFMFDLQHSKVFQTSKDYQEMYSGLMSNFYFSALMHKCDYYYYRGLVNDVIEKNSRLSGDSVMTAKKHLCQLYANNLSKSETLWLQDIMSSNAEKYFNNVDPVDKRHCRDKEKLQVSSCPLKRALQKTLHIENNIFKIWHNWFADPEEEIRRVCFIMKEAGANKREHMCNVETLVEYLRSGRFAEQSGDSNAERGSDSKKKDQYWSIVENLTLSNNKNRVSVSQWFLRRFAFNDVLKFHIPEYHLFKYHLRGYIILLLLFLVVMILCRPEFMSMEFWNGVCAKRVISGFGSVLLGFVVYFILCDIRNNKTEAKSLIEVKRRIESRRRMYVCMALLVGTVIVFSLQKLPEDCKEIEKQLFNISLLILRAGLFIALAIMISFRKYYRSKSLHQPLFQKLSHCLSNFHLFFPRLIASITAAWLSLAIGNELFRTFFDSAFSWASIIFFTLIVLVFVCYEINKIMPHKSLLSKLWRSCQFVTISYAIAFVVGLFIINFIGEKMLERSGCMQSFYSTYVNQQVAHRDYWLKGDINTKSIKKPDYSIVSDLQHIKIIPKNHKVVDNNNYHTIASVWDNGTLHFFILRDFLIQFAFVAMFIGVFIQMIFEEKQVTEI